MRGPEHFKYDAIRLPDGTWNFAAYEKGRPECGWIANECGLEYHYYGLTFPVLGPEFRPKDRRNFRNRFAYFLRRWAEGLVYEPHTHMNQYSRKRGLL